MNRQSLTVSVDGVTMSIERAGHGYPVVCLPALAHDSHDFDALIERLGDRFELICVDWPGQGRSGRDPTPASAARYAALLEALMARLNIDRPIIIGNSIGGAAAIRFASHHAVRGLVLCDSGGLVEVTPTVARFCRLHERFFAAGERGAWWFGPAFALYYRLVLPSPAATAQRRRIVKGARTSAPALRQAWISFSTADADLRDLAASLDTPIWVAWAEGDKVIPLKRCLPAIRRLKAYILTTFKGGHSPFLEQPDAFAEGFEAFVADLRPAPRQSHLP